MTESYSPESLDILRTIRTPTSFEAPRTKGSRFIVVAAPITSPEAALEIIAEERQRWRGATHHCFAWRLGETFRVNDDGEPNGTAGRPILRQIDARQLSQIIVIVTRYFGGTKLGTGGLIRAYGSAAGAALDIADIRVRPRTTVLQIRFPYELTPIVEKVLHANSIVSTSSIYDAHVTMDLSVPVATVGRLQEALRDSSGGRLRILTTSTEITRS